VLAALVIIHDPAHTTPPQPATLRDAFGLSRAETELALALLEGQTLAEYAACRGVSLPTVKSQLRSLFARTDSTRQAVLVRLLAGFGGGPPPPAASPDPAVQAAGDRLE